MSSPDLSHQPLEKIDSSTPNEVQVEGTITEIVWLGVRRNHTPDTVQCPEEEEDNKQMVRVPESFIVRPAGLLNGSKHHGHESNRDDPSCPGRAQKETNVKEAPETHATLGSQLGCIVQVGNRVNPCEEDNGPGDNYKMISFVISSPWCL